MRPGARVDGGERADRLDDAGVVDERVDPPEGLARAGDRRLDLGELGDVAGHRLGLGAALAQPGGERGDALGASGRAAARAAPSAAIASAAAAPMPRLAPVMITDFPASWPMRALPRDALLLPMKGSMAPERQGASAAGVVVSAGEIGLGSGAKPPRSPDAAPCTPSMRARSAMAADLEALTARLLDGGEGGRRRGGGRDRGRRRQPVDRGAQRRAGAGRARRGGRPRAPGADRPAAGLRLVERHRAPTTIAAMAERAVAMAREAPEDRWCGLAEPGRARARTGTPPRSTSWTPRRCRRRRSCRRRRWRPRRRRWRCRASARWTRAGAGWSASRMHLAASNGFSGGYARTGHSIQAVAICGEGTAMERDYAFESRVHRADLPAPEEIGRLAGERDRGARRRRQAADRRLAGALRRAGGLRADRAPGAGDQRQPPSRAARAG